MYFKLFLILFVLKVKLSTANEHNKPSIQDLLVSSRLVEGKKLFLSCQTESSGAYPIQFEWFFNKQKIESNDNLYITDHKDNSMLNINSMSVENAGLYTCQVGNSFGSDSKSVNLNLNSKYQKVSKFENCQELMMKFSLNSQTEMEKATGRSNCEIEHGS